ncbi:kinase-like domain-containing protein [Podospora aff. communis PSN243]|uniref:Kinase-like domain-containing protein n=1 Tax=Podospora aff. communis PSN243 TaxID=3040156 RepID=A0AAV9G479_9PEZI|nr:kinase-like domain-containing protein [Podospora aff. communis PSN243]
MTNSETEGGDTEQYIQAVMRNVYGREIRDLAPLGGGKNSIVHSFIAEAASSEVSPSGRAAVSPLPRGAAKLVMRVANPEAMLNEAVRAQSEVAMMLLMRQALAKLDTNGNVVPRVYGWSPPKDSKEKGWLLMEFMPGVVLADAFPSLGWEKKTSILQQIARIFAAIQTFVLPSSVKGFGGLNFDDAENIITGPTPIHGGGPSDTLTDLYTEYFRTQMSFADKCDVVKGWKTTGSLRDRLDKFAAEKLPQLLREVESKLKPRPTLVHADLDLHNLLFDPPTNTITALIDFDFSHVASQADEYFYSLDTLHSLVFPPTIDDPSMVSLRNALLHGFPQNPAVLVPTGAASKEGDESDDSAVDWQLAAAADEAFADAGVKRPSEMPGIDELSVLYWFIQDVSPPLFFLKRWRSRASPEKVEMIRAGTQANLEQSLERWGY